MLLRMFGTVLLLSAGWSLGVAPGFGGPVPEAAAALEEDGVALAALGEDGVAAAVEIDEWPVPWEQSRPRDPYVAPDGRVWFVGQRSDYLAVLDPESGEFSKHDLKQGVGPHNLIVDGDGIVWYAGNRDAHIGRLDPATGEITEYAMPDPEARDPHTMVFDSAGDIWFTLQGSNMVGKFDPDTGETVTLIEVPTPQARPYGIVVDASDRPWIVEVGTYKLGTADPETFEYTEIELPRQEARPRRIGLTSDGAVWYVDYAQGRLGRYDSEADSFEEWTIPGGPQARPYGMAVDGDDRIWLVETAAEPNRFVGFDPDTEEFFSITPIGSGGGTVRHMFYHPQTDTIWFGTDTNTIARARLP